jgi:hypothetical protein
MPEADRADQEIDDAIREWRLKFRDLPDALGVARERIEERWEWFRREVYNRIAKGKSTAEIVDEVGAAHQSRSCLPGAMDSGISTPRHD